jgi:hypothetical protein
MIYSFYTIADPRTEIRVRVVLFAVKRRKLSDMSACFDADLPPRCPKYGPCLTVQELSIAIHRFTRITSVG